MRLEKKHSYLLFKKHHFSTNVPRSSSSPMARPARYLQCFSFPFARSRNRNFLYFFSIDTSLASKALSWAELILLLVRSPRHTLFSGYTGLREPPRSCL